MHTSTRPTYRLKMLFGALACALLLSACGGGGGSTPNSAVTGVETPTKVSIANTN